MPEPAFLVQMSDHMEIAYSILFGTIVIEHRPTKGPARVVADDYSTPEEAHTAVLAQTWIHEERGMELTGLWVVPDANLDGTGSRIRALRILCQNRSEHRGESAGTVVAYLQERGKMLHA